MVSANVGFSLPSPSPSLDFCARPLVPGSARLKNPRWRSITERNGFSAMKPPVSVTACKRPCKQARHHAEVAFPGADQKERGLWGRRICAACAVPSLSTLVIHGSLGSVCLFFLVVSFWIRDRRPQHFKRTIFILKLSIVTFL